MSHTVALVLETNNLQGGGASTDRTVESLRRLLEHLARQTYPWESLTELVITHEGFTEPQRQTLEAAAGRQVRFVQVPPGTGYYEAKNLGFDATTADLVAFGDGDCWPEETWLERLVAPFAASDLSAVAGRTAYRDDLLGAAASAIDFMYFHPSGRPDLTKNFYANNVVFRRELFAAYRYRPIAGVYRGHCQMLGMRLWEAGVPIRYLPEARTVHRFPDTARELIQLRLLRGQDTVELTPHFGRAYLPRLRGFASWPLAALVTLAIRWVYSAQAIAEERMGVLRSLGCTAVMSILSAADAAGAILRTFLPNAGRRPADGQSLSYHQDVDALS